MMTEVMSSYERTNQIAETEVLQDLDDTKSHLFWPELVVDGYQIEKRISITSASENLKNLNSILMIYGFGAE